MDNLDNIINLINNHKWDTILKLIKVSQLDPNKFINNNNTIAHYAALNNNKDIITYLLQNHKSSLTIGDINGNSAVHLLAMYNYIDLLKLCLKNNPDFLDLENGDGETILDLVYNNYDLLEYILNMYPDINLDGLLMKVILNDKDDEDNSKIIVKLLLKHNVDLNMSGYDNDPPLCLAISTNKHKIAKLLLKAKNIDINIKNSNYVTPLILALLNNECSIAEKLINMGCDINYWGPENQYNVFLLCISYCSEKIVDLLLEKK